MKKFPAKGIMYFSLSTLFLITSCKKTQQTDMADSNKLSAVINNRNNAGSISLNANGQSSLFIYLNTITYDKAIDTLKRYLTAKGFKTEISDHMPSKTTLKLSNGSLSADPENATAEEWLTFSQLGETTEVNASDPVYGEPSPDKIIEKSADWVVMQHHLNWWKVVSTEGLIIKLNPGLSPNSYSPRFIGFNHAGSRVITDYPINPIDWNENLNEHFPSLFGNLEDRVVAHVAGTLGKFGFSKNGEGYHIFHTSDFIH